MNQNPTLLLPNLRHFQPFFNPTSTPFKLPQKIFIFNIINLDAKMFIFLPVFEIFEVVLQNRDDVRYARSFEGIPSTQSEDSRILSVNE
jgi:hypothetical protein